MANLSFKTIETVGVDFVHYVNQNHTELQTSYSNYGINPNDMNFTEFCVIEYLKKTKENGRD